MDITFHKWGNSMVYHEAQIKCFSLSRCNAKIWCIFSILDTIKCIVPTQTFLLSEVNAQQFVFPIHNNALQWLYLNCRTLCQPAAQDSRSWLLDLSREDWIYSFLIKADFIIHTTLCLSTWLFVCWTNLKQRTVAENAKRKCFPWKCQGFC